MQPKHAVSLALVVVAAGCTSGPGPSFDEYYADANDRWSLVADGGFSESHPFDVPEGAKMLTIRATFRADRGFHFTLYDPRNQISSNFVFSRAISVKEIEWIESPDPREGAWRIGVDCVRHCQFAFGFYHDRDLPDSLKLEGKHAGATRRFEGTSDGGGIQNHEFEVPAGGARLRLEWSLDASDRLQATLRNPAGSTRFGFTMPYDSLVDSADYDAVVAPSEGKWALAVLCNGRCHYVFGATY